MGKGEKGKRAGERKGRRRGGRGGEEQRNKGKGGGENVINSKHSKHHLGSKSGEDSPALVEGVKLDLAEASKASSTCAEP